MKKIIVSSAIALITLAPALSFALTPTITAPTAIPTSLLKNYKGGKGSASSTAPVMDLTCVNTALDTRDAAISQAMNKENSAVVAAVATRTPALKAAYALTTRQDRNSARKAAWDAYEASAKAAHSGFKTDKNAAWKAFETTMKSSCKVENPEGKGEDHANG